MERHMMAAMLEGILGAFVAQLGLTFCSWVITLGMDAQDLLWLVLYGIPASLFVGGGTGWLSIHSAVRKPGRVFLVAGFSMIVGLIIGGICSTYLDADRRVIFFAVTYVVITAVGILTTAVVMNLLRLIGRVDQRR